MPTEAPATLNYAWDLDNDGVFGEIHIFEEAPAPAAEEPTLPLEEAGSQIRLF